MTIKAKKFTPKVLLGAPRRSAGLPNHDGTKVLYSVSTYSFADHEKHNEIRVLDVKKQESIVVTDDKTAREPKWLRKDGDVVMLMGGEEGKTNVVIGKAEDWSKSYTAGIIPGPVENLKIHPLANNQYGFAVSGKATPAGDLYNPETAKKPHTTGRVYNTLFVRHWDHYVTENRNSIFLAQLVTNEEGKFVLSDFRNALKGTGLESPIEPFGGIDHFDISYYGLVFTAKDPELNPALHTKTNVYYFLSDTFWTPPFLQPVYPTKIHVPGFEGASTSPIFSPSGLHIAFLKMRTDGYESDKNQLFMVDDLHFPAHVTSPLGTKDLKGRWDRSPSSVIWSAKKPGEKPGFYFIAEDHGRSCLFAADWSTPNQIDRLDDPRMIVRGGAVSDIKILDNDDVFISSTSLTENSLYSLYPRKWYDEDKVYKLPDGITSPSETTQVISSQTHFGSKLGLSYKQVSEVEWPGAAEDTSVHAWVVKPSDFKKDKKYPLAYIIHGGPQGAWEDSWSTRWNPAVFAEQGYVVITPNPTGSTGFGQEFTDAIQGQWGGLPYEDLVKGFDWIEKNLDYVDTDRAVALGASYGGYMMNWIQGHDLGRRFRALVTHDGVFSMTGQLASEELYFPFHDLRGRLWDKPENWAQWDPSRFTKNWSTPHLIIHSELDYRLTISEGLAAFHTLQSRGVESQFLTFPDENHWVLKPENNLLWHRTVLDWINGHVGITKYSEQEEAEGSRNDALSVN
ncbi:dipeptidyl-peptidase-like protein V precursor [Westerdykella ornata]|uniref:Dipeptidyl-peptidase V n=1 Tax=Westerdykella ornata TaxID=318751 RepID=A0A6A6JYA7_WESOR|nr:dipeptidyl-peptidase-like protein V precursor [Westerdykella ornata]KAF2281175.1 dipeptidyl-peptidase-like protein V precursor [Westerdykella ornata]